MIAPAKPVGTCHVGIYLGVFPCESEWDWEASKALTRAVHLRSVVTERTDLATDTNTYSLKNTTIAVL